jgi:hypothetical protein
MFREEYYEAPHYVIFSIHSPIDSIIVCPNILPSFSFSNTMSLRTAINVRDQVPLTFVQNNRQTYRSVHFNGHTVLFRQWPEAMQLNWRGYPTYRSAI